MNDRYGVELKRSGVVIQNIFQDKGGIYGDTGADIHLEGNPPEDQTL